MPHHGAQLGCCLELMVDHLQTRCCWTFVSVLPHQLYLPCTFTSLTYGTRRSDDNIVQSIREASEIKAFLIFQVVVNSLKYSPSATS